MDYPDLRYTVYVDGAQVEGRGLTKHEAEEIADYYEGQGYEEVQVYDMRLNEAV